MRIPFSTVYFCGNCEEEVVGLPAGARVPSGRPLCLRCTEIGEQEGWGAPNRQNDSPKLLEGNSKRGIIAILFMMGAIGALLFFWAVFIRKS